MGCISDVIDGVSYGIVSGFVIGAAVGAIYAKILKAQHIKPIVLQNGVVGKKFYEIWKRLQKAKMSKRRDNKIPQSKHELFVVNKNTSSESRCQSRPENKESCQSNSAAGLSAKSSLSVLSSLPTDESEKYTLPNKVPIASSGVKRRKGKSSVEDVELSVVHTPTEFSNHMSSSSSDKKFLSQDSFHCRSENYLLRKTEELMSFNVGVFDKDNELNSLAKQLAISKENEFSAATFEVTNHYDKNLLVHNERDILASSIDYITKDPRRTQSFAPFTDEKALMKNRRSSHESEILNPNPISNKLFNNKKPVLSYFLKKLRKTQKKSKHVKDKRQDLRTTSPNFSETSETVKEDLEIKEYLYELYFYIIFIIFITIIALGMVSSNMYYFTDMTVQLFFDTPNVPGPNANSSSKNASIVPHKTLRESNTFGDFWAFAETTMIDLFYWNFYYSDMDPVAHTEKDDKKMFFENQILGVPRIRQVRVRNDSCQIHPDVQRFFQNCYYYYSVFSEETRPIKAGMENSSTATAWVYTEAKKLNTSYYWGEISIYGGGGYYLDFAVNKDETVEMIKELKENLWVSRATRAIFIDFNLYNANVNLFCICKIVLEFPPVGGMLPSADFHSLKLIRYLSAFDFFVLGCECIFLIFIIYYTFKEVKIFKVQKYSFFFYWWNYVDLSILLLSYAYIILSIILYIYTTKIVSSLDSRFYQYTEFQHVKELQINYNNVIAILLFLCWIKLFKYLNFNVILVEFRKTLSRSIKNILGFFPMFLTMFVTFALLAYLLFGNQVKDYNTVWLSFLGLLQAFLGEFEYKQIQESNHILGPIFYIAFIFFIFFVLLNVFIAIINEAYASVKSEFILDTPKTGEYCKRGFLNLIGCSCCGLDKKIAKKSSVKKKIIYNEMRDTLKAAGFKTEEINIFFAKYNINVDSITDEKTKRKIMQDLELDRIDFGESAEQFQITALRRKLDNLNEKMEELEISLQPVADKVDVILNRLNECTVSP